MQRAWEKIVSLGTIGPRDPRGRRYAAFGPGSAISFPPGGVSGERWIRIGANTLIGQHVSLAAGMAEEGPLAHTGGDIVVIGDRCNIGRGSSIVGISRIEIGDDVTTGPNVYITDHNHTYADPEVPITRQWPSEAPVGGKRKTRSLAEVCGASRPTAPVSQNTAPRAAAAAAAGREIVLP